MPPHPRPSESLSQHFPKHWQDLWKIFSNPISGNFKVQYCFVFITLICKLLLFLLYLLYFKVIFAKLTSIPSSLSYCICNHSPILFSGEKKEKKYFQPSLLTNPTFQHSLLSGITVLSYTQFLFYVLHELALNAQIKG